MSSPAPKKVGMALGFGIIAIVIVIVLYASVFTVDQSQQAIIVEFGKPKDGVIVEPGLYFKKPFVQEVRYFDKRLLIWDGDPNEVPTRGREFIAVDTTARWRISDPLAYLTTVQDEGRARDRISAIVDSVVRDKVSNTDLEEIVRSTEWQVKALDSKDTETISLINSDPSLRARIVKGREGLTREILEQAGQEVKKIGIELVDVRIKRLNYIPEVQRKVEDRMISERQRVAAQFRSEGEGASRKIAGRVERERREILSGANRKAEEIRGKADAEATRIYAQAFSQDPEFYAFFKSLESYTKSIDKNTTLMLDANSDFFRYLQRIDPPAAE